MTDKEQNRSEVHQEPTSKDIIGMNFQGKDRRRFIKRAIVAAPFILTVTSRPVWAINCTLSGQLSGNISPADGPCGGEGCSPGFWKNRGYNQGWWDSVYHPGRSFAEVFGYNPFDGDPTLYEVILFNVSGSDNIDRVLGFHAVAALQNAANPNVDFAYSTDQVITYTSNPYLGLGDFDRWQVKDNFDILNNLGSDLCG